MKRLTCEMCGSTDLIKEDGYYVCQSCGTKYSVEEAKKMMIEGTVDVKGTVKIDESDNVNAYLDLASSFYEAENFTDTIKYTKRILEIDIKNPKAWLLKGKAEIFVKTSVNKLTETILCIEKAIEYSNDDEIVNESKEFIYNISDRILDFYLDKYSNSQNVDNLENFIESLEKVDSFLEKYNMDKELQELHSVVFNVMPNIIFNTAMKVGQDRGSDEHPSIYDFEKIDDTFVPCKNFVIYLLDKYESELRKDLEKNKTGLANSYFVVASILKSLIPFRGYDYGSNGYYVAREYTNEKKNEFKELYKVYAIKYNELKPDNKIPLEVKSGGCYVATCVYGSYDCPEVWTLRRYRDEKLGKTWYGRLFIRTYYLISPTLVKWFGNTNWFKNMWKPKLDKMVAELKDEGFEDTPYQDKDWR